MGARHLFALRSFRGYAVRSAERLEPYRTEGGIAAGIRSFESNPLAPRRLLTIPVDRYRIVVNSDSLAPLIATAKI